MSRDSNDPAIPWPADLVKRVKEKRAAYGWSQVDMHYRAEVSQSVVCQFEKGLPLRRTTLNKILTALNMELV